jgi:hypothetical protein
MTQIKDDFLPAMAIGFLKGNDLRILGIDENVVVFENPDLIEDSLLTIKIALFDFKSYDYKEFILEDSIITNQERRRFLYIYECKIGRIADNMDQHYFQMIEKNKDVNSIFCKNGSIYEFRRLLKCAIDDFPVYPLEKDNEFKKDFTEQERDWFSFDISVGNHDEFSDIISSIECCFFINNFHLYNKYLSSESIVGFADSILEGIGIQSHGLFSKQFSRIYIGNEYCSNLFPDDLSLLDMLNKAFSEGFQVTIALSVLEESSVENLGFTLNKLDSWCMEKNTQIEVTINDWGILYMINTNNYNRLIPIFGRLQNKRIKDPRYEYWYGYQKYRECLTKNNLNSNHLCEFLNGFGIRRFEFESAPLECEIPKGCHSLHFPYYQVNTAGDCRLKSICNNFMSIKSRSNKNCPRYCSEFGCIFPAHLNLYGRGNSIFGFDKTIFTDPERIKRYAEKGIDRIVFSAE